MVDATVRSDNCTIHLKSKIVQIKSRQARLKLSKMIIYYTHGYAIKWMEYVQIYNISDKKNKKKKTNIALLN